MIEIKTEDKLEEFPNLILKNVKKSIFETFSDVGFYFVKSKVPETFKNKGKRGENPEWKPLSIFTIASRLLKHGGKYTSKSQAKKMLEKDGYIPIQKIMAERQSMPILRDTGELVNSFTVIDERYDKRESVLTVGTKLNYAVKHQFGDPNNTIDGHKAPLPQRKMIFITIEDEKEITDIFNSHLSKNL